MHATIGVISDTHGLLRNEACKILQGCDLIIHAGDICGREIITVLQSMQRAVFVLGNMDRVYPDAAIQKTEVVEFADKRFYVLHDLYTLNLDPAAAGLDAVIHGHTHLPDIIMKNGVLYLNPGSIGPKRRGRPVSMALIHIADGSMQPEILSFEK
ncbi:MAG TPA: metallophosphoesterase [Desulfonatronum sp.]|nr:metallophosphoesterase [Desulfonatronum sp.]